MIYPHSRQAGLTLVELMVSITIGLLILLGLAQIFASNSQVRANIERNSRHLENGRYALQILSSDLRLAGYLGEYVPPADVAIADQIGNPCSTSLSDIQNDFMIPVYGYAGNSVALDCLTDYYQGDIIVIRRTSTCAAFPTEPNCDSFEPGVPHFQTSGYSYSDKQKQADCISDTNPNYPVGRSTFLNSNFQPFRLETGLNDFNLHRIGGCEDDTKKSIIRRFYTRIYYIAKNNLPGDGIPTLKKWELGSKNNPVPIAEGIESLQIRYGIDNNKGMPANYTSTPASIADWNKVVSVQIGLTAISEGPAATRRQHDYQTTVLLENPAGRK